MQRSRSRSFVWCDVCERMETIQLQWVAPMMVALTKHPPITLYWFCTTLTENKTSFCFSSTQKLCVIQKLRLLRSDCTKTGEWISCWRMLHMWMEACLVLKSPQWGWSDDTLTPSSSGDVKQQQCDWTRQYLHGPTSPVVLVLHSAKCQSIT